MTNSTSYFYQDNHLNKGYQKTESTINDTSVNVSLENKSFFDPKVLEIFESVHPGSIAKIIEISQREQRHSHAYEISNLSSLARSRMFGQILSFISLLVISYVVMNMVLSGYTKVAILFSSLYFISVLFISLFSSMYDKINTNTINPKVKSFQGKRHGTNRIRRRYPKAN